MVGVLVFVLYIIINRLDGNNHLGQDNFLKQYRENKDSISCGNLDGLAQSMQNELLLNLIDKEEAFSLGYVGIALTFSASTLVAFIAAFT